MSETPLAQRLREAADWCAEEEQEMDKLAELLDDAAAALSAAEQRAEGMGRDAARYQWLRQQKSLLLETVAWTQWTRADGSKFTPTHRLCAGDTQYAPQDTMDAAIDAALTPTPGDSK